MNDLVTMFAFRLTTTKADHIKISSHKSSPRTTGGNSMNKLIDNDGMNETVSACKRESNV